MFSRCESAASATLPRSAVRQSSRESSGSSCRGARATPTRLPTRFVSLLTLNLEVACWDILEKHRLIKWSGTMFFCEEHLPNAPSQLLGGATIIKEKRYFAIFLWLWKLSKRQSLKCGCNRVNLGSLCKNGSLHFITLTFPPAWFSLIFEGILSFELRQELFLAPQGAPKSMVR